MAEKPRKHYVKPKKAGKAPDEQEALAMGYELFDKIASEQAQKARQEDEPDGG
jgi:hypothetical protein